MGIIDILQQWTFEKKAEHWWKRCGRLGSGVPMPNLFVSRIARCYDPYAMSAVPPKQYAEVRATLGCLNLTIYHVTALRSDDA
jgi:hypothetical protein